MNVTTQSRDKLQELLDRILDLETPQREVVELDSLG